MNLPELKAYTFDMEIDGVKLHFREPLVLEYALIAEMQKDKSDLKKFTEQAIELIASVMEGYDEGLEDRKKFVGRLPAKMLDLIFVRITEEIKKKQESQTS